MFWDSFNGIEKYTTSVIGFINKCIDDVVPTVTVRTYPNQTPWITSNISIELKSRAAAFKEWETNPDAYKNPAMPSDESSNKQSVNTGLRLNPTTPALTLVGSGRACKLLRTTKGNPTRAAKWREPTRRAKCLYARFEHESTSMKHAREHQLFSMTV